MIQTAFLGDLVLSTALLESLHRRYPEATLDVVVRKGNEGIFQGHPYLGRVIPWEKSGNKVISLLKLLREVRKHRYNLIINLQRFFSSGLITLFAKGEEKRGFKKNPLSFTLGKRFPHPIGDGTHEIGRNHELVKDLCGDTPMNPRIYPGEKDERNTKGSREQGNYVCLAPSSIWYTKQWPLHKWIELVNEVKNPDVLYLLGGKGDRAFCQKILEGATENENRVHNLAGELSPLESAALIRDARITVANDSAPVHLASAVNAPVVVIYCSTVPRFGFGPLAKGSSIVETQESLSCRPCGLHGYRDCPLGHFRCAEEIPPSRVLEVLAEQEPG